MDTNKLRYFLAVADSLSFSMASRRLGIGQPVLSRAIKDLEDRIGADLFFRGAGAIKLTPAGEVLLPRVQEALMILDEGFETARKAHSKAEAVLSVGYLTSSYESFVGDTFNQFNQAFPHIQLNPYPLDSGQMIDGLRSGKLDVAFVGHMCPELEREFDPFLICSIPLCVVLAEHHPLANEDALIPDQLKDYPLITLDAKSFPGRHELVTGVFRNSAVRPRHLKRVDTLLSAMANIAHSDAFTLMPQEVESIASRHVRFIKLVAPDASIAFHAIVRKGESRQIVLALLNKAAALCELKARAKNALEAGSPVSEFDIFNTNA